MGMSPERRVAHIWAPRDVWVPQVPPWDLGTIAHPSDSLKQGFPIAAIPALDSFELLFLVLIDAIRACFMLDDRFKRRPLAQRMLSPIFSHSTRTKQTGLS